MKFQKTILALSIPAILPTLATQTALAQERAAQQLEEVVVTGTRKEGQSPTETLSPIDVIGGEVLSNQASFDLTESLTKISPSLNTQRFPIADGTAFVRPVTLRNLSPDHTLVLVNGTRRHRSALVNLQLAPLGTINQGSQGVDFALFPSAAIKRVEVLRDGASAQYGSDAIAGVVNVILKDDNEGFNVSAMYGEYDKDGDGERVSISANGGLPLGESGFINLTGEYSDSDITSTGHAREDAEFTSDLIGKENVAYDGFGQRWGDPDIEAYKFFVNSGYDISETTEIYGNASYAYTESEGGFFWRSPVLPGDANATFAAAPALQMDGDGDGVPDPVPQSFIDNMLANGITPDDYFEASDSSPSGYWQRNAKYTEFPGGFAPTLGADITDYAVVLGGRGEFDSNFTWDLTGRYGQNEVDYGLNETVNPSLGVNSPTSFDPGTITQEEYGVNLDFVKTFDDSPLNLAFGAEWRRETYEIEAGDEESWSVGPSAPLFEVGSNGFQGYAPNTEGDWDSDSWGAYVDVETDITDKWTVGAALRYEDYDEYDDTLDWKLSTRYDFTDTFALRATANTGFRAPSPGQANTLNITTSANEEGTLVPSGFYPPENPVAIALGSSPLENEESTSYTLGLVWTPGDRWELTVDYYTIEIDDRIAAVNFTVDQDAVDRLNGMGFPNAEKLLGSAASYFTNGFDTEVSGVDVAVASWWELYGGVLTTDLRYNYNEQDLSSVQSNVGADRVFDLENQVPESSAVLSLNYTLDGFASLVRVNYYDEWSTTAGLFGPGDASDAHTYGDEVLVDIELSYTFAEKYTIAIGGENVFDEFPEKEVNGTLDFLGAEYAVTSPWGFNGAFWYGRISASF